MQRKFNNSYPASLSIYFTLMIVCVGAFILAIVEITRFSGLNTDALEYTNLAEESLFAGYQPVLLEEYDMFWLDGCFGKEDFSIEAGEGEMEALLYDNLQNGSAGFGTNLYKMRVDGVTIENYLLATDREGKVFQSQAAAAYKSKIGEIAVEEILKNIKGIQNAKNQGGDPESQITSAESTLEALKEEQKAGQQKQIQSKGKKAASLPAGETSGKATEQVENPLEVNQQLRKQGILSVVLPPGSVLSAQSVDTDNCLLKRDCREGTDNDAIETETADRLLMQQYIKRYGGNFLEPAQSGGLSYGEEYVIAGKGTDKENLEYVVKELLIIREVINFAYLNTDEAKNAEALAAATVLAGITANPPLIEVVAQGILAAWAYGESICDLKILLSGGKVPLLKTAEDWNSSLSNLGNVLSGNYQGAGYGQCYEDYLQVLLYAMSTKKASYRCMDLMEYSMKKAGYEHAKMDHMILRMKIEADYQTDTIFLSLLGEDTLGGYSFKKESSYCYH